jgi:uncharacterized membrane protein
MTDWPAFLTVLAMMCATYTTRIAGYMVVRNLSLSPRAMNALEAAPGCVLISVLAPQFGTKNPVELAALAITILAATRLSLFNTMLISMGAAAALRFIIN